MVAVSKNERVFKSRIYCSDILRYLCLKNTIAKLYWEGRLMRAEKLYQYKTRLTSTFFLLTTFEHSAQTTDISGQ